MGPVYPRCLSVRRSDGVVHRVLPISLLAIALRPVGILRRGALCRLCSPVPPLSLFFTECADCGYSQHPSGAGRPGSTAPSWQQGVIPERPKLFDYYREAIFGVLADRKAVVFGQMHG